MVLWNPGTWGSSASREQSLDAEAGGDAPQGAYPQRCDLAEVGSLSHKGTLALLPVGSKGHQKFAIGDDAGVLHAFEMKRGEATTVFKFEGLDGAVTAVTTGGVGSKTGRIYATQGSTVVGVTKKGKEFFRLNSNLSEPIRCLKARDAHVWATCDFLYNQYRDGKDDGSFYMCRDRINALAMLPIAEGSGAARANTSDIAALGCNDRCIRVICGSDLVSEIATDGAVVSLEACGGQGTGLEQGLLYGTAAGTVGHLASCAPEQGWLKKTWELNSQKGAASVVRSYDITGSGVCDLIIARDDGCLQVFTKRDEESNDDGSGEGSKWQLWFEAELEESIRAMECGTVCAAGYKDIIVCTYSGKVISFTTEPLHQADGSADANGRTVGSVNSANKIKQLQREVAELEKQVVAERETAAKSAPAQSSTSEESLPPPPQLLLTTQCNLDAEAAAVVITLEAPVPLETVLLHATVPLDLAVAGDEASGGVVLSVVRGAKNGAGSGIASQAVFRCPEATSRFVFRARTIEGNSGEIVLTAVARTQPQPSAQVVRLKTKPLSLHSRLHILPDEVVARPKNVMKISGAFSMSVMHDWIATCLPDVPPKTQEESATMHFLNVFTRSVLTCEYRKGEAIFSADSICAIAIIKEVISREATARRIAINDTLQTNDETVGYFIGLIHPKLQAQAVLARQVALASAVTELAMGETDAPWLPEEYRHIAQNAPQMQKALTEQPRALEYLIGVVADFFVDWQKVQGHNVRQKMPELSQLLANYDRAALTAFILEKHSSR